MPDTSPIEYSIPGQIALMQGAVECFNREEWYLLENDLSERCICARFAGYLERQLRENGVREYVADVEYNRGMDGVDRSPKRIYDELIVVDLIVHKRGHDPEGGFRNLICVEMKKSTNPRGCRSDEARLRKMTDWDYGFCYSLGVMLLADMQEKKLKIHRLFSHGQEVE